MSKDAKKDTRTKKSGRPDNQVVDVVMPDIYAEEHVSKKIDIEVVVKPSSDTDESSGFNPYDTATLLKK